MVTTKIDSAMATVVLNTGDSTDSNYRIRTFVSDPIPAQTIAAQTIEFQIRGSETNSNNDLFIALRILVVSSDGLTTRGTILALIRDGTELATSLTNRRLTATTTEVAAQADDRILVEIGTGGDPFLVAQHDSSLRFGDASASDLPEDDSSTDDLNPWLEFPNDISFAGAANTRRYSLLTAGVG